MVAIGWESPVAAVAGKAKGKDAKKLLKIEGLDTVGDLLSMFPRT
jgi:hypothetical protein